MVITQTPFRMSFFGGGTDIPDFFEKYGGSVISTTFDKYCYVTVRHLPPYFDFKTHLTYSKMEYANEIDEIEHPAIRNTMKYMGMSHIRLTYDADLPAKSGLGTSSAFVVGMLNAFGALNGQFSDRDRLAKAAIYIERTMCNEAGGWQDQIASAYGGLNRIDFYDKSYSVRPIIISDSRKEKLQKCLMLFYTGFSRFSYKVFENQKDNRDRIGYLVEMKKLTDQAEKILEQTDCDLNEFGKLLGMEWELKKKTGNGISNENIDRIYKVAEAAGALGGKVLGAGGGGFMLFYVCPEKQQAVREALGTLVSVPFKFETTGSRVIYFSPEEIISG